VWLSHREASSQPSNSPSGVNFIFTVLCPTVFLCECCECVVLRVECVRVEYLRNSLVQR